MALVMGTAMVSCVNDDTDMDDIIAQYQVEPVNIELDFTALSEAADVPVISIGLSFVRWRPIQAARTRTVS